MVQRCTPGPPELQLGTSFRDRPGSRFSTSWWLHTPPRAKNNHLCLLCGAAAFSDAAAWREGGWPVTAGVGNAREPIRIGNASGFYGDRFAAMQDMLEGGDLDVLTGDYLAELTMLILGRDRLRDPCLGYALTFLRQLENCLGP